MLRNVLELGTTWAHTSVGLLLNALIRPKKATGSRHVVSTLPGDVLEKYCW